MNCVKSSTIIPGEENLNFFASFRKSKDIKYT